MNLFHRVSCDLKKKNGLRTMQNEWRFQIAQYTFYYALLT